MRILGIDPGLRTTGFGVLDVDGPRLAYVASGVIRTHDAAQGDLPARLKLLFDGIREVHTRYQPQPAMVPHYDLQSPLEDLEESEYCLRCLRDAGVQPRQVPPAMHGMNLRQLCDTPFVTLSQDALRQLDQALRQNGAQQP